jgi:hypothetical protein
VDCTGARVVTPGAVAWAAEGVAAAATMKTKTIGRRKLMCGALALERERAS